MKANEKHQNPITLISLLIGLLLIFQIFGVAASAGEYPEMPIKLLIPFGVGGGTDIAMRFLSSVIPQYLGQPVVIVNKAGASGSICMEYITKQAKPDGYTMMGATVGANAIFPARFINLPFQWDAVTFISRVQLTPMILVVRSDSPFKTFNEMLDYIRKNPKKLKFGTGGVQGTQNIGIHVLLSSAKIPYEQVSAIHYDGSAECNLALLRGDIDFVYNLLPATKPHVQAGKMRGLLVPTTIADMPDIPTPEKLGLPKLDVMGWQGICGPPNLPDAVVKKWAEAVEKSIADEAWKKMVDGVGDIPAYLGPDDFKKFVTNDVKRYRAIFEELKLVKDRP